MAPTTAVPEDDDDGGNIFTEQDTIVGIVVGAVALILLFGMLCCCFCCCRKKKKPGLSPSKSQVNRSSKPAEEKPVYDYPMDGYDSKTQNMKKNDKTPTKKRKGLCTFMSYLSATCAK